MKAQTSYSRKLAKPSWQKVRLKILERDNWTCQYCQDTETELQVHHLRYSGEPQDAPLGDLITTCADCHFIISDLKRIFDIKVLHIRKKPYGDSYGLCAIADDGSMHTYYKGSNEKVAWTSGLGGEALKWVFEHLKTLPQFYGLT